ncbi:MAG: hypothetical protein RIR04_692, partial [Pseudomonadota bacterium]
MPNPAGDQKGTHLNPATDALKPDACPEHGRLTTEIVSLVKKCLRPPFALSPIERLIYRPKAGGFHTPQTPRGV